MAGVTSLSDLLKISLFIIGYITYINGQGPPQMIQCTSQSNSCKCETPQGTIDLSPLASNDHNNPAFRDQPAPGTIDLFSWNPCYNFNEGSVQNVAVCQVQGGGAFFSLGTQESATFMTDQTKGLQIRYTADTLGSNTLRTSYVQLICNKDIDKQFTATGESPPASAQYYMAIESKYACPQGAPPPPVTTPRPSPGPSTPGGISIGTILCIIFIVVLVIYLIGGIAFMKFRGKEGAELVPNVGFWKELPLMVKDGGRFVVSKVKGKSTSYENI
ncbi:unnamed protein product [Owenia fusiformis]|uniref:Autophagy-related protein 27 n=1 Tax=Owenia fusiformis TaxID=6347 RepID=A0A8J1YAD9_OWEFU|nr:unnamed protein product [Owenia fusiformis]